MEKILKSSTRVPANLYVKRSADSQIVKIIQEMLRPGYISVARQMGKTNLLQNAKREIEGSSTIVIYIDLSALKHENSRQYFRFIIDTILEVEEDLLFDIKNSIAERRASQNVSASGEHDRELRLILKSIPQNLVLILDEVDALAKAEFSDEIFAQIRSIYFMRSTHPVLERLTYILSGVIEPTKLIKNKDNSPFNIAEQIYLDDFSYAEYLDFISKTGLNLSEPVIAEIYDWASGNPRITYELCSALEDMSIQGEIISVDHVRVVVQTIYLSDFNAAPVDHIRDIVTNNSLVRNAVKSVVYGENITDEMKDQLYLYGIIEYKSRQSTIKIKNKIIAASLSEAWLNGIETQTKGFYEFGLSKIASKEYDEGISYILRYADSPETNDVQRSAAYFSIADAYGQTGDYVKANDFLLKCQFDKKRRPYEYYYSKLQLANNLYYLNLPEESFKCFEEIINNSPRDINYYTALFNKANYSFNLNPDKNESSLDIYKRIEHELSEARLPEGYTNSMVALCNYKLASIYKSKGDNSDSYNSYKSSLRNAPLELRSDILAGLILVAPETEIEELTSQLYSTITDIGLAFQSTETLNIEFTHDSLVFSLAVLHEFRSELFEQAVSYSAKHFYKTPMHDGELVYDVGHDAVLKKRPVEKVLEIFKYGISLNDLPLQAEVNLSLGAAFCLSVDINNPEFGHYANKAFGSIKAMIDPPLMNYYHLIVFAFAAISYRTNKELDTADSFISYLVDKLDAEDEQNLTGDMVAVYYIKASVLLNKSKVEEAAVFYRKASALSASWDRNKPLLLTSVEELETIIHDVSRIISLLERKTSNSRFITKQAPAVSTKTPERNAVVEVVYSGEKKQGKYKRFEADILSGKCILISTSN